MVDTKDVPHKQASSSNVKALVRPLFLEEPYKMRPRALAVVCKSDYVASLFFVYVSL